MKSWLLVPVLFAACSSLDKPADSAAAPAPEVVEVVTAPAHGIHNPFERVRETPDRSQGAFVGQVVGADTWVQISYHRPGARGRDVWTATNARGDAIVPFNGEPIPWRAGANEPTILAVSRPVLIEDQEVDAGKYVLMFKPGETTWTLILQEAADNPGAYGYDAARDVISVEVTPVAAPQQEWLGYGFEDTEEWSATGFLRWGRLKVPFRVASREIAND